MDKRLTMLMILDGFGINEKEQGNAVKLAKTPNIDKLMKTCKTTVMNASGLAVGLPEGQMGNSEVGHTNIGAGRIVYQELTKITKSIEDGDFFSIPEFNKAIENCKKYNSKLHIMGLLSDGGVHSHIRHLFGLLEFAKRKDFENVYVHCFMDGRDTIQNYTSWDFYQMVEYTATFVICLDYLNLQKEKILRMYMYIALWMEEIHHLHQEKLI